MTIKSGRPIVETALAASTDTTVTNSTTKQTKEVYSLIFHDSSGTGGQVVDLYLSDDATSAAGTRIEQLNIPADGAVEAKPVTLAKGKYLVAQSDAIGVNFHGSFTQRDGVSA